jgi:hypothetical protein
MHKIINKVVLTMTKICSWKYEKQEKIKFAFSLSCMIQDEKMFGSGSGMRKWSDPDPG